METREKSIWETMGRGLINYDFRIHPRIQIVFPVTYSVTETIRSALNSVDKLFLSAR